MGRAILAALLVVTFCLTMGCGRRAAQEEDNSAVSPSVPTSTQPPNPATPTPAAVSPKPLPAPAKAQPKVAPEPGWTPIKPAAPTPATAGGDAWQQMREARETVHSYKSTTDEGPMKTTQYVKMANGKPVIVKVKEASGTWVLADLAKHLTYIYDPKTRSISKSASSDSSAAVDDLDSMRKDGGAASTGMLNGKECWVVKVGGQFPATYWVDKKLGIVRQIADSVGTRPILLEDINGVPEKEFKVPSGVPVKTPKP